MPEQSGPPSMHVPPRWASPRQRVITGVQMMARRGVRDVLREARRDLRARKAPVDDWMDNAVEGRSGRHASDFLLRFAQVLHAAGECPQRIKARMADLAHRVADAAHLAHRRA